MSVDWKMIYEAFYTVMTNRETGKIALLAKALGVSKLKRLIDKTEDTGQRVKKFCRS